MARRLHQAGFTYLWLLWLLAISAAGLAAIAQPMSLAVQRDRELELRFRGREIARALSTYWAATPGDAKQLPLALQDLVDDRRGPRPLHHLRRVYTDPFTGLADWVLVTDDDGRIAGVHSRSDVVALDVADLPKESRTGPVRVSALVFRFSAALAPAPAASAAPTTPAVPGTGPASSAAASSPT